MSKFFSKLSVWWLVHKQTRPGSNLEITWEHMGLQSCLSERCSVLHLHPLPLPSPRLFKMKQSKLSLQHLWNICSLWNQISVIGCNTTVWPRAQSCKELLVLLPLFQKQAGICVVDFWVFTSWHGYKKDSSFILPSIAAAGARYVPAVLLKEKEQQEQQERWEGISAWSSKLLCWLKHQTYADNEQNLFLFFSTDFASSAAMELLKEQISNITQELSLLKEQQALHTGGFTIILDCYHTVVQIEVGGNKAKILYDSTWVDFSCLYFTLVILLLIFSFTLNIWTQLSLLATPDTIKTHWLLICGKSVYKLYILFVDDCFDADYFSGTQCWAHSSAHFQHRGKQNILTIT